MSCNGLCYIVNMRAGRAYTGPSMSTPYKDSLNYRPSSQSSYFTNPNAMSALEFELSKKPAYERKERDYDAQPHRQGYRPIMPSQGRGTQIYDKGEKTKSKENEIAQKKFKKRLEEGDKEYMSIFEENLLYAQSLIGSGAIFFDYSLISQVKAMSLNLNKSHDQGLIFVQKSDSEDLFAPIRMELEKTYDGKPKQPKMQMRPEMVKDYAAMQNSEEAPDEVDNKRRLLEDLIAKEKRLLIN